MKLSIKLNQDTITEEKEVEMIITDDGFENDYWGITIDGFKYDVHGKELEMFMKSFLANR